MARLPVFQLPALSQTVSIASTFLPLTALIEFADTVAALHLYELTGYHSIWNWAITPRGAHALLEEEPNGLIRTCYLDKVEKDPVVVTCIDGKWGDMCPCVSSHTVRMCASSAKLVPDGSTRTNNRMNDINTGQQKRSDRPVRLTVIRVEIVNNHPVVENLTAGEEAVINEKGVKVEAALTMAKIDPEIAALDDMKAEIAEHEWTAFAARRAQTIKKEVIPTKRYRKTLGQRSSNSFLSYLYTLIVKPYKDVSWHFLIISRIGWLLWACLTAISFMTKRWYASAWMISVVLSGLTIRYTHGHTPRTLFDIYNDGYPKLVLTTNTNTQAIEWTAYIGGYELIDSLLKIPFIKSSGIEGHLGRKIGLWFLRFFILAQWTLIIIACGGGEWDAFFITFWLVICFLKSVFFYTSRHAIRDWLHLNNIKLSRCEIEMRNRWVMMGALVALNPDWRNDDHMHTKNTKWISRIVAPSKDREEWENALYRHFETSGKFDENVQSKHWWPFILEAQEVVDFVNEKLELRGDAHKPDGKV